MPRHDPIPGQGPADHSLPANEPDRSEAIRRRQRSRSIVTALILFALVALFYAISIAKML